MDINTTMKIAVLLRGQTRYYDEGSFLFRQMVMDRFPQHEFEFFVHTWHSVSSTMIGDANGLGREFNQRYTDTQSIVDRVMKWSPVRMNVSHDAELFDLVKRIIKFNLNNTLLNSWWKEYRTSLGDQLSNEFIVFHNSDWMETQEDIFKHSHLTTNNHTLMFNAILLHYVLGQMYSAGCSMGLLDDYMTETGYVPDLVWSTRQDCITWVRRKHAFEELATNIDALTNPRFDIHDIVLTEALAINNGRAWTADYNFFSTASGMKKFLMGDNGIQQHMWDLFTAEKLLIMDLINSGSGLQHQLWTKLGRNISFRAMTDLQRTTSTIYRPGMEIDYTRTYNTLADYTQLEKLSDAYDYPGAAVPPTAADITESFNNLESN